MRPVYLTVPAIAAAVLFTGAACGATATPTASTAVAPSTQSSSGPASGSVGGSGASTSGAGTSGAAASGGGANGRGANDGNANGGNANGGNANADGGNAGGASSGGSKAAAACRTGDVGATVVFQPERTNGSTRMAMVLLTNKSKNTCAIDGWASISLVNAADEVVPVKTTRVDQPGAPVRTTLKPGRTGFAGIKWTACDKGDDTCGAGNTLRFNLQASTDGDVARLDGFPSPEASDITMKRLQIGSVQPSNQGVVAW
jgi:hypothetical protein